MNNNLKGKARMLRMVKAVEFWSVVSRRIVSMVHDEVGVTMWNTEAFQDGTIPY